MMRAKPWRPRASPADGNRPMRCVVVVPSSPVSVLRGTVDRLVRCPVGVESTLITPMGCSELTVSRHLPSPSPSAPPLNPSPDSRSLALTVRDASPPSESSTTVPGESPLSSTPSMRTSAVSLPGLTSRRLLAWLALLPGLNVTTRCPASVRGTKSCMLVRKPSSVRM